MQNAYFMRTKAKTNFPGAPYRGRGHGGLGGGRGGGRGGYGAPGGRSGADDSTTSFFPKAEHILVAFLEFEQFLPFPPKTTTMVHTNGFIIDIFDVLKNSQLNGVTDHEKRLNIITNTLFQIVYRHFSQGMIHTDKALLALLLLRIYLKCHPNYTTYEAKFDHLQAVPEVATYEGNPSPTSRALNDLVVINALQPDRLVASAHLVIAATFGLEFMQHDKVTNLHEITEITSFAIGSSEGFQQAEKALESSSKSGQLVLLKNVHLAPSSWLTQIEKRLHVIRPHLQFRLIFTAKIHPKLPISVIQASRVVVFEPATGLKANMLRSLSSIPPSRITKAPVERARLYFLVCWFHALVQKRLRCRPLGWAHSYEFSDADLRMACDTLDVAVDSVAMGRNNVSPDKLPWKALRTLFSQCIYGGKIDNIFDQTLLDCFLQKLFTSKAFEDDFVLINNVDGKSSPLYIPEAHSRDQLLQWIYHIKFLQMPNWIGLPKNAKRFFLLFVDKNSKYA
uniref:Dynein heavy chain n=1 Tax=Panagrolaimus davidi TaxID=227884 RepID=A0A914QJU2_9BILA